MKIAIMQPTFLPWIGYFVMIARVDAFVFLDCVQFERCSWQSRNKIKLNGKEHFVSLHLQHASFNELIQNIRLNNEILWRKKLLKTIYHAYNKSENFKEIYEILEYALFHFENLSELNIFLIKQFSLILKLKTPLIKASSLSILPAKKENLLLEICKFLKADEYLSPDGSKNYLEPARALFMNKGVSVEYFDMIHPVYTQQNNNFIKYLSVIDLLFNAKNSAQILNKSAFTNEIGGGVAFCYLLKIA